MRGRGKSNSKNVLGQARAVKRVLKAPEIVKKLEEAAGEHSMTVIIKDFNEAKKAELIGGLALAGKSAATDYQTAIVDFTAKLKTGDLTSCGSTSHGHLLKPLLQDGLSFYNGQIWTKTMFYKLKAQKPLAGNEPWWKAFFLAYRVNNVYTDAVALLDEIDEQGQAVVDPYYKSANRDREMIDFLIANLKSNSNYLRFQKSNLWPALAANLGDHDLLKLLDEDQSESDLFPLLNLPAITRVEYQKNELTDFPNAIIKHKNFSPKVARRIISNFNNTSKVEAGQLLLIKQMALTPEDFSISGTTYHAVEKVVQIGGRINRNDGKEYEYDQHFKESDNRHRLILETIKSLSNLPTFEERFATRFARAAHEIYPNNPKEIIQLMIDHPLTSNAAKTRMRKIKAYRS